MNKYHLQNRNKDYASSYDAFSHFLSILRHSNLDWGLAMITAYLDDSGTHDQADYAVAAMLFAEEDQWKRLSDDWLEICKAEAISCFHMKDCFHGKNEFEGWTFSKRQALIKKLAVIIRTRVRVAYAFGVERKSYDALNEGLKKLSGPTHYTFAVKLCIGALGAWRVQAEHAEPVQFIFDWETKGKNSKGEIMAMFDNSDKLEFPLSEFGMAPKGYAFEDKLLFPPLQAADMIAWEANRYFSKVITAERENDVTENMRFLRERPFPFEIKYIDEENYPKYEEEVRAMVEGMLKTKRTEE